MTKVIFAILTLGSLVSLSATTLSYTVTVDSSSIGTSTPGFIEFQFNQANASTSLAATASVSGFSSTGFTFDNASNAILGGVTGSLSSPPIVFDNTVAGANLFDQGVTKFGTTFSFVLTLDGAALATTATDGSEFFVYLLDSSFNNLATTDGLVAAVTINGDTSVTKNPVTNFSTIDPYIDASAPEPSTLLLGLGGAMLVGLRSIRRK